MYDQGTHGHRSISASLKAGGIEVHNIFFGDKIIQDMPTVSERELQSVEHLIRTIQPDLVGLSVTSMLTHAPAVAVSQRVKKVGDIPIIFGGPYPALLPEFCPFACVIMPPIKDGGTSQLTSEMMAWHSFGTPLTRIRLDPCNEPGARFLLKSITISPH
jgi:hypothetical protein